MPPKAHVKSAQSDAVARTHAAAAAASAHSPPPRSRKPSAVQAQNLQQSEESAAKKQRKPKKAAVASTEVKKEVQYPASDDGEVMVLPSPPRHASVSWTGPAIDEMLAQLDTIAQSGRAGGDDHKFKATHFKTVAGILNEKRLVKVWTRPAQWMRSSRLLLFRRAPC